LFDGSAASASTPPPGRPLAGASFVNVAPVSVLRNRPRFAHAKVSAMSTLARIVAPRAWTPLMLRPARLFESTAQVAPPSVVRSMPTRAPPRLPKLE